MTYGTGKTSTRIKLTERAAAEATPNGKSARLYLDTQRTGFGLAVSALGVKSYFVARRVNGKPVRFVFGKHGERTVAEARVQAEQILAGMATGANPVQQRKIAREDAKRAAVRGVTLRQALAVYESHLLAKRSAEVTKKEYRQLVERHFTDWMDCPLVEITRPDCRQRHAAIIREVARKRGEGFGSIAANKAMRAFRAIHNLAAKENPDLPLRVTASVQWVKETRRKTVIKRDDLPAWYKLVKAETNTVRRDFSLAVLFTGLRYTNAAEAEWSHVDWKRRVLLIPKPKSGTPFELPLTDFLIKLLKARRKENKTLAPDSKWIFPAASGEGHIVETRIEDSGYTNHDLRRTFMTVAESLDISPYAIKFLVNHALLKSDVTGGYIIQELERMRRPMQKITNRLLALCSARGKRKSVA